jgi:hypothetical protein
VTADGASAKIYAKGDGWTVRNVAFKGNHPGGHYLFTPAVSKGGTATVENLYMGDGQTEGTGMGGIWVNANAHYGTLNFRNVHIAHFIDNGLYGTGPGAQGHGGVVNVADSYFDSNNIANIRVGSLDGRTCRIENCVVEGGSTRASGVGCSAPGTKSSRGVWAWWGRVEVTDSDIGSSPARVEQDSRAGDPEIISTNTRWGSEARSRVPDGVPLTREQLVAEQSERRHPVPELRVEQSGSPGVVGPAIHDGVQQSVERVGVHLAVAGDDGGHVHLVVASASVTGLTGTADAAVLLVTNRDDPPRDADAAVGDRERGRRGVRSAVGAFGVVAYLPPRAVRRAVVHHVDAVHVRGNGVDDCADEALFVVGRVVRSCRFVRSFHRVGLCYTSSAKLSSVLGSVKGSATSRYTHPTDQSIGADADRVRVSVPITTRSRVLRTVRGVCNRFAWPVRSPTADSRL